MFTFNNGQIWSKEIKSKTDNNIQNIDKKNIQQLEWLEKTSPKKEFTNQIASKKYFFYGCHGYSLSLPGLDMFDYDICYKKYAQIKAIEGTSDCITSEEYKRLNNLAYNFAEEYNLLMKEYLLQHGMTICNSGENWGHMFNELNEFIWGTSQNEGYLVLPYDFKLIKPIFKINLQDKSRVNSILLEASKCLKRNGIHRRVYFIITENKKKNDKWEETLVGSYSCENGKVITDDKE